MFRTFAGRLFRRHFPVLRRSVKYYVAAGGAATGGASISLSFFSGETTARSKADLVVMNKELDGLVHIRESDVFYDNYMLDRAYEILKKYAIVLNYVSEQEGTKSQIKNSVDVKAHFERAVQLNPLDPTGWHLLGVWHYSFADLSGMSRMAVSAFFASPPSSTFEEALRHFQRAEVVQPGFYSTNAYYMGLCLEKLKRDKEETVEWFKKAFREPVLTKDDMETHVKVADHLTKKYGFSQEKLAALISNRP